MWDRQKAVSKLESPEPEVLFVCGTSLNRDRFLPYFTKVFNLRIADDTMRRRLQARTADDWEVGEWITSSQLGALGCRRIPRVLGTWSYPP
jgi:hypothetical protein